MQDKPCVPVFRLLTFFFVLERTSGRLKKFGNIGYHGIAFHSAVNMY